MRKRRYKSGRLAVVALLAGLTMTGCAQSEKSQGEIAVICKAQGVQFWDAVKAGADDGGEELNYTIAYQATANDTELGEQIKMVENAVSRKVSAIVIAPNDVDGLNVALDKAVSAGIPVITIDSDVSYEGRLSYIGSDNVSAGAIAGRAVKEELPDGGQIAIVGHVEKSQTAMERIQGFTEELENEEITRDVTVTDDGGTEKKATIADSKYEIVTVKYCENELETANKQTKAILDKYPDIKVIYGTNENSTTGICDAVAEMGKAGQVKVIGFNASDKEVAYVQDGTLTGTIVQNPYNMGYLGVKYADSAAKKETKDLLPELITSVTLVTDDNLENEDIRFLINPAVK
ncbi:MAG: substrate-binding domain-containing protein [Oscillospiraceae bacterium]|nr:substrate-binding domain-containing protein [Oscillospiraceae bacterium]